MTTYQLDTNQTLSPVAYDVFHEDNATGNVSVVEACSVESIYYLYCATPMLIMCVISTVINTKIVLSAFWIRRTSLSPTLLISLSLAAADAYTSLIIGISLYQSSLIPKLMRNPVRMMCVELTVEALRLGGIIVSVAHLLALTFNHYLGILKPLHYTSIMTHKYTVLLIAALWTAPTLFFLIYFASVPGDGFQSRNCSSKFLKQVKFRILFAPLFYIPLIVMLAIYGHIFIIVNRHQRTRLRFSRLGSSSQQHQEVVKQEQIMRRNVKAIHTTLFIIGSFIMGWMPAVLFHNLACEGCLIELSKIYCYHIFCIMVTVNSLCILKMMVNPIIYAARMQEIQNAMRRMNAALCKFKTNDVPADPWGHAASDVVTARKLSLFSSSVRGMKSRSTLDHRLSVNPSCIARTPLNHPSAPRQCSVNDIEWIPVQTNRL